MRKFLLFIALIISGVGLNAQNFSYTSVIDYDGYSLKFTVTKVDPAECEVICSTYPSAATYITIPDTVVIEGVKFPVKKLGDNAFAAGNSNKGKLITGVHIPNTVEIIGDNAFKSCRALSGIEIPNTVTSIGSYAFYECSGFLGITIPNSVKTIGDYVFAYCTSLLGVTIPKNIETMGTYAFDNCKKLRVVTFENGSKLTALSDYVFNNTDLRKIVIPNGITSIGSYAFASCYKLEDVTIPNSVTTIGNYAFKDCDVLSNINIPNSVTTIGEYAFYNCTALTNINIPNSVTTIGQHAFNACKALTGVAIPKNITTLSRGVFRNCEKLTNVTIPNNVSWIGAGAFAGCTSLKTVVFENNSKLEEIEDNNPGTSGNAGAFSGCTSLNSIQLPNSLVYLGSDAFEDCTSLTHISIPNSVTNIANGAFNGSGLISIQIPDNVVTLGTLVFENCSKLQSVSFSKLVTTIPERTFKSCTSLVNMQIPNTITKIGAQAFNNCSALENVYIPNSVTYIDHNAFDNCSALENVYIPNSVTYIGQSAFSNCSALENIEIPNSVTSIDSWAFESCISLESVEIPGSVAIIGYHAFDGCLELETVYVANGVKTIDKYAFANCYSLRDVTLPSSLTKLDDNAFSGDGLIEVMRCFATTPPSKKANIFTALTDVMQIQVPQSALATYQSTSPWNNYTLVPIPDLGATTTMNFEDYVLEFVVTSLEKSECKVQCSSLPTVPTAVSIPGSIVINGINFKVADVADNAFANCVNVTGVVFDNGVKTIGQSAFNGCSALSSVEFPETMETLGKAAFANCGNLTDMVLPSSIKNIGEECFSNCDKLMSVKCRALAVPTTHYKAFNNIPTTMTVQVPQSSVNKYKSAYPWNIYNIIELIEVGATSEIAYGSYSLKYTVTSMDPAECEVVCSSKPNSHVAVIIPAAVTIGGDEFAVTSIGNGAFANAYNVTEIKCHIEEVPATVSNAFLNLPSTMTIQVPANSVSSYQEVLPWSDFNIVAGFRSSITATANNSYFGSVSGDGIYNDNTLATLTATPAENCTFINWMENGSVVSNNPQYSFVVNNDRNLVANFISTNYWNPDYASYQNTMDIISIIQLDGVEHNVGTLEIGAFCGDELRGSARGEYKSDIDRYVVTLKVGGNAGDEISFKLYDHMACEMLNLISPEAVSFEADATLGEIDNPYVLNFVSKVNISVVSNPVGKGVVLGAGVYNIGEEVTLIASSQSDNYYFINWTENGNVVSESTAYTFVAENDRDIVANFSESNYWAPNTTQYPNSMTIIGVVKIENVEQRTSDIEIGAFCGDELRGAQRLFLEEDLDRYYLYLMIYGETNDVITFRMYDHGTATESELSHVETVIFDVNGTLGSLIEPYEFNFLSGVMVSATCNPVGAGTVNGTGSYTSGSDVVLTATANDGFEFSCWTLNGNIVSSEATYSFVAEHTVELVANFNNVHSRDLKEGWNWYSTYVNVSGSSGLDMMKESLGESAIQIKDQNNFVNYQDGFWYGWLNSVSTEQMYMIQMAEAKTLEMAGAIVDPSETPIQLATNWKWIAYPLNVSMNLASALSNYTPADGDYIKSQNNGFAQYYESLGWRGTLNSLSPGQGYMYQNTSGMVKTLIYPEADAKAEIKANITSENNYWVVDDTKYPTNMSVIAVVENDGMEMKNYEIGVFSDDECRGSARPIYIEELDSHIIFLTVYGVGGETIKFRYYDVDNAECYDIDNTMVYSVNATIGDIAEPYVMNFIPANVNEMSENEVRIYPNPVNRNSEIYFDAECERVEVYNALGVMVSGYENVNHINGLETAGVYMIKITNGDAVEYNRVVVR